MLRIIFANRGKLVIRFFRNSNAQLLIGSTLNLKIVFCARLVRAFGDRSHIPPRHQMQRKLLRTYGLATGTIASYEN